ncbi:MAG: hypothetical protein IH940_03175 [Acidobacteria bacterium]|nr:hypothetical protein [Acidobacteriota bacterium]
MVEAVWLIPAFPLAGFLTLLLFGRRLGEPVAGWLATLAMVGSLLATIFVYLGLIDRPEDARMFDQVLFEWVPVGNFSVDVGFLLDPLSITMCLFITGVSAVIHLYSVGYMQGDANFSKFFLYLNLFAFSMLMLVLGDNMLLTFLGWEGVGACSYFLIAFWFDDETNATAGKKAFVTNDRRQEGVRYQPGRRLGLHGRDVLHVHGRRFDSVHRRVGVGRWVERVHRLRDHPVVVDRCSRQVRPDPLVPLAS